MSNNNAIASGTCSGSPMPEISCCLPSSSKRKSSFLSPCTACPAGSVTDTGTITRFEVVLITSSITSGSGFGVGVGLGLQGGGGGGMFLIPPCCPNTVGTDRKMASTPIRNAGHKCFFSTPNLILDTLESVSCRRCWLRVFLSYRFPDGMIHDSLVPRQVRGVAHLMQLRATSINYPN